MWSISDELHSTTRFFISSVLLCCFFFGCAKSEGEFFESNSLDQDREENSFDSSTAADPIGTQAAPTSTQSSARPGPDNTGPSNASLLRASGSITVTQDGAIIENVDVSGAIKVQANNVTIRNFRINATGLLYGIRVVSGYGKALFEDGEIIGSNGALIVGPSFTARRLNLHDGGSDGLNPYGDVTVENCWIHHLGKNDGSHADGTQMGAGSNFVYRNNYFDMPINQPGYRSNATIFGSSASGTPTNVLVEGNWLNGGNYTIYLSGNSHRVINNRFGRDVRYGLLSWGGVVWTGNVWDDTGAPAP